MFKPAIVNGDGEPIFLFQITGTKIKNIIIADKFTAIDDDLFGFITTNTAAIKLLLSENEPPSTRSVPVESKETL